MLKKESSLRPTSEAPDVAAPLSSSPIAPMYRSFPGHTLISPATSNLYPAAVVPIPMFVLASKIAELPRLVPEFQIER